MPMTPYSGDVEIITNIGTTPQERGLSTDQFKAKFDEGLKAFVTWFNDTHKTEFDAHPADLVTDAGGAHGLKVESGTWTPTLFGITTEGNHTYTSQEGKYIKIGGKVTCYGNLRLLSKDAAMDGGVKIGGLPFVNSAAMYGVATFGQVHTINFETDDLYLTGNVGRGVNVVTIYITKDNSAPGTIQSSQVGNATWLIFAVEYTVD